MLKLFFCRAQGETPAVSEELFSSYRKEKLAALKAPRARREAVFSELLLRFALREIGLAVDGPLEIAAGEYGKPFLKGGEAQFSISHSCGAILCAVSDRDVGADVQIRSKAKLPLMERFFAEEERAYVLSSQDTDDAFTEIWAKKESWIKRSGLGLSLPLPSFSVLSDEIAPLIFCRREGEYTAAVCGEAVPGAEIDWIEVNEDALLK